jgi:hypothetical protein
VVVMMMIIIIRQQQWKIRQKFGRGTNRETEEFFV